MLAGCPEELSFGNWASGDALPDYDDDITGFFFSDSASDFDAKVPERLDGLPAYSPDHASFSKSSVVMPIRAVPLDPEVLT